MSQFTEILKNLAQKLELESLFGTKSRYHKISGFSGGFGHFLVSEYLRINPQTIVITSSKKDLAPLTFDITNQETIPFRILPTVDFQSPLDSYKNRKSLNDLSTIIQTLAAQKPALLTSIESMLQPNINISNELKPLEIEIGREYTFEFLRENFLKRGFVEEELVTVPGEFSVRGGIFDFFSHKYPDPIRLDFFGDELEEIRTFETHSQKSLEKIKKITISDIHFDSSENLQLKYIFEVLPESYQVLFLHENDIVYAAEQYVNKSNRNDIISYQDLISKLDKRMVRHAVPFMPPTEDIFSLQSYPIPKKKGSLVGFLSQYLQKSLQLILCYTTPFEKSLLEKELKQNEFVSDKIILTKGHISSSFYVPTAQIAIFSDFELFNKKSTIMQQNKQESKPLEEFLELTEGDFVVHTNHGIGINHGIKSLQLMGRFEDFLCLEFAEAVKVYVPLINVGLVQKYIGGSDTKPALSKIGSKLWENKKKKARKEVEDIAHELLQIQANRKSALRTPYRFDDIEYQKFAEEFPYEETPDQTKAIELIVEDMTQNEKYMDRIVCGDVGFGKTEIAMRAALIAALGGVQVAVLAPTTILVEQHFKTFSERFQNFPILIEKLNRFTPQKQVDNIIERLQNGSLDIIIGTHKLLSSQIKIKNLGLLIIDEEQRFGVKQKEKLKKYRSEMDLLTLTATPIPRTLHMSLIGVKDISILATPPRNRLPIDSKVCAYKEELIGTAIRRELDRNGQIFFVHNRIASLPKKLIEIKEIVPEASIEICHGQMNEEEIENTMNRFVLGKVNILLSTTIIESGLDIPNANTIFIDYANMYGLSQLHQMRGRIGRSDRQGYAILLVHSDKKNTRKAEKRLQAIEEYTDLGAGFNLSVADMEIRGVGNLLGAEQHGSVASVGYDMYCQLLEECILELKHENKNQYQEVEIKLNIPAFIPDSYIFNESEKLKLYRRLHRCHEIDQLESFKEELEDRYGVLPTEADNLLLLVKIRIYCQLLKIESLEIVKKQLKINLKNYDDLLLAQILRKFDGIINLSSQKILTLELSDVTMQMVQEIIQKFLTRKLELGK
jgi:transcription-repair coupling factor (superfamily II helicase)